MAGEHDVNTLVLVKDEQKYVVFFRDHELGFALRALARWAGHPELNFTWADATAMAQQARKSVKDETQP